MSSQTLSPILYSIAGRFFLSYCAFICNAAVLRDFLAVACMSLHFGDGSVKGSGGFCSWEYGGVVAIVDFEGAFAGGGVYAIVMSEGSERKPFCPVGLEVIDKHTEVFFDLLVDSLGLPSV